MAIKTWSLTPSEEHRRVCSRGVEEDTWAKGGKRSRRLEEITKWGAPLLVLFTKYYTVFSNKEE
jgi:hypothetical protein